MGKKRKKKTSKNNKYSSLWAVAGLAAAACAGGWWLLFSDMSASGKAGHILIDQDDNLDSVYAKIGPLSTAHSFWAFKQLTTLKSYGDHIRPGYYRIGGEGALQTFRHIRNGIQSPVRIILRPVRTVERLATEVGQKLQFGPEALLNALTDPAVCARYGYSPQNFIAMFIPNTYEVYWNVTLDHFLDRMQKESKAFWTFARREKADAIGMSPNQVITLASIVDEETNNVSEMPMIAGMYVNRLNMGMLLQADPTVKFATGQFGAKRVYNKMLQTDSPYNTYKYKGLPPGPICIPIAEAVDAVLNYEHHDYLYMCAKEDFSGRHNFARTYAEHQANAARYVKALNERGIK